MYIQTFLNRGWDASQSDVNEATSNITSIFQNIKISLDSQAAISRNPGRKAKKKRKNKPYFDNECESVYHTLTQTARSLSKNKLNSEKLKHYFKLRKDFKRLVRKKARQNKAKILNSLIELEDRNPKAFWDIINKFKNSDKEVSDQSSNIAPDEWCSYFKNIMNLNVDKDLYSDLDFNSVSNVLDKPFLIKDITKAIKSVKNNTSVGFDCISNEMLKNCSSSMVHSLCKLFNLIYDSGKYPDQWSESMVKPLFKSGDETDPNNYRGIAISSCLSKLFIKTLSNRLEDFVKDNDLISNHQIGFRRSHRTIDHVYTLKSIIDKMFRMKKHLHVCFVDFRKAFDSVWRQALFYKLSNMEIKGKILQIIVSMYSNVKYSVKLQSGLTESFSTNVGVKQGCI